MKTTVSKTIPFKKRDEDKKNSKYNFDINKNSGSSKVIRYPKYKKKKDKGVKIIKNNKFFVIVLGLIMFFSLLSFIDNNLLKDKYGPNGKPLKSHSRASSSLLVSETEFSQFSDKTESSVRNALKLSGEHSVKTKTMHKNGNYIYSQGDVSLNKDNIIYFDAIFENKQLKSLLIDGKEYLK